MVFFRSNLTYIYIETNISLNWFVLLFLRIQTHLFDISDPHSFMGSLAPIQGLPGAAQLDMNVSCLFMHEVS